MLPAVIFEVEREVLEFAEKLFGRDAMRFALDDAEQLCVEHVELRGDGINVDPFDDSGDGPDRDFRAFPHGQIDNVDVVLSLAILM